jgi:hypothetical protein
VLISEKTNLLRISITSSSATSSVKWIADNSLALSFFANSQLFKIFLDDCNIILYCEYYLYSIIIKEQNKKLKEFRYINPRDSYIKSFNETINTNFNDGKLDKFNASEYLILPEYR